MEKKGIGILICLIIYFSCTGTGSGYEMNRPQYHPYLQQNMQRSDELSSEMLHSIIIQSIQPFIGNDDADKSPSIAVGLVTRKEEVALAIGSRDLTTHMPADGDTLFGIGSISKLFVGLILADAVANNELSLSDKANSFLEKEMQIDDRITLRHLVSHFSGLPNFPDNMMERKERFQNQEVAHLMPAQNYSRKDLMNCLANNQCLPVQTPGETYLYSNFGIGLLSIILENRFGYNDFLSLNQVKITNVLNMEKTSTNNSNFLQNNKNNLAQGYQYNSKLRLFKPAPLSDMGVLAGSGELISSANDMNVLLKMLTGLYKGPLEGASQEVERELENTNQSGVKKAYAHRVRQAKDGGSIHFKFGQTPGYSAVILWRKNPELGLILLSNRGNFHQPMLQLSQKLMGRITQKLKQNNY